MNRGVFYVAYGKAARDQVTIALTHLYRVHPTWRVVVVSDVRLPCRAGRFRPPMWIQHKDTGGGVRDIKLKVDQLSPFEYTLYMDADTRLRYPIAAGWDMLADGWDMLITPTGGQYDALFKHIEVLNDAPGEVQATLDECGGQPLLALQGGMMWFHKNERTRAFFEAWREEWARWKGQDQAALMRALRRQPLKLWLLSRDWNGGSLMGHYHAHARRSKLRGAIN